jgi:hypothetical protein
VRRRAGPERPVTRREAVPSRRNRALYPRRVDDDAPASHTTWHTALFDRDSFVPVLLLAIGSMLAFPFADTFKGGSVVMYPFIAGLLLLGMHRSRVSRRTFRLAVGALITVAVCTAISSLVRALTNVEDRHLVGIDMLLYAVLFAIAFPAIVRRAFQHRRVTYNTLAAAISAYIVLGLWFAVIYRGIASASDTEFFATVEVPEAGEFVYYSFITLTTVGYGDFVPITDAGRAIAVAEAVAGQVYLVTAVARLVSLYGSERDEPSGPPSHDFVHDETEPD